jgi:hypothetical protein
LKTLLKKDTLFIWITEHETTFQTLKQALTEAPVLAVPDFSKKFCIETNACKSGVGVVLMQKGHPLAYISKPLGPKHKVFGSCTNAERPSSSLYQQAIGSQTQGLSTYEKEYLTILIVVEH